MKKHLLWLAAAAVVVCAVLALAPRGGDVAHVVRTADTSATYAQQEIDAAMDVVERHFTRHFAGCTLLELTYDEELSQRKAETWAERYGASRALVLTSSFEVDESGASPSLEPGGTHTRWEWVLTQSGMGRWELQTWGYC